MRTRSVTEMYCFASDNYFHLVVCLSARNIECFFYTQRVVLQENIIFTSDKGGGKCVCPRLSVSKLLKNACVDLDEMLRVDRCRDMDELITF